MSVKVDMSVKSLLWMVRGDALKATVYLNQNLSFVNCGIVDVCFRYFFLVNFVLMRVKSVPMEASSYIQAPLVLDLNRNKSC